MAEAVAEAGDKVEVEIEVEIVVIDFFGLLKECSKEKRSVR